MEEVILFITFIVEVLLLVVLLAILNELQILNKIKGTEVLDERVTRRDINGDYGFRNPLVRSNTGYKMNRRGQFVPTKPNAVEEDEDV